MNQPNSEIHKNQNGIIMNQPNYISLISIEVRQAWNPLRAWEKDTFVSKDDQEGNAQSMEDRDDSKYIYIQKYLLLMIKEMNSRIKMIGWRCENDGSVFA